MFLHFAGFYIVFAVAIQATTAINFGGTAVLARSQDPFGGKKLVSYPTLVSILKSRNASRPILSQEAAPQILGIEPSPDQMVQVPVSPPVASVVSPAVQVPPSPHKENYMCTPVSQEKNALITKLCSGRRSMSSELASSDTSNRCLQRYCVTIIPGDAVTDDEDDEMLQTSYGNDIVAYTDCNAVNGLFRVLVRSAVAPKCYNCGS